MIASTTPALLAEVAAGLPTDGVGRAAALRRYNRNHLAVDLADLPHAAFVTMLNRARLDWERTKAQQIRSDIRAARRIYA